MFFKLERPFNPSPKLDNPASEIAGDLENLALQTPQRLTLEKKI